MIEMTREDAIKILNTVLLLGKCDCPKEEIEECLKMAIKALEQEPNTGHWIEDAKQHHVEKTYHCSECGHGAWGEYEKTEYCGGCGAKMVKPRESRVEE